MVRIINLLIPECASVFCVKCPKILIVHNILYILRFKIYILQNFLSLRFGG